MYFIVSKMLNAHNNHSVVGESLVHCWRVCEFIPHHHTIFIFFFVYFLIFLYNCLNTMPNHFQNFSVAKHSFMKANSPYPIELTHSVASHISVVLFANAQLKGHFV